MKVLGQLAEAQPRSKVQALGDTVPSVPDCVRPMCGDPADRWAEQAATGLISALRNVVVPSAVSSRACLFPLPGPTGEAIRAAQQPLVPVDENRRHALGWIVTSASRCVKAGGNRGCSSYPAIDLPTGRAIGVAASQAGLAGELTEAAIGTLALPGS